MKQFITLLLLSCFSLINAQSYFTYVDSADACISRKDWIKAEANILSALRLEPANYNNSLLLSNLATIQRMQGRNREAINNYSLALNITPNAVTLLNNRGILYFEVDSVELARADFLKVIDLDERDITSRFYYGMIKLNSGDLTASKTLFDEVAKINSKSVEAKEGKAVWNKVSKNYDEAIKYYSDLINKEKRIDWITHRAECYLEVNYLAKASDDISDAMQMNPDDGYLYLLKALLNKKQFQFDDSEKNIELAVLHGIDKKDAEIFVRSPQVQDRSAKKVASNQ